MSPVLLSTAVAIPLCIAGMMFLFFYLRARSVARKLARIEEARVSRQTIRESARGGESAVTLPLEPAPANPIPVFRPLSFYIEHPAQDRDDAVAHPLSEIPGLDPQVQRLLYEMGYTSVEHVARWGRADVRAVSALLGVDAGRIESDWVASARMLLSVA